MTDEGKTFINKSTNKKFRTVSVSRTHQTIDFLAKYFSKCVKLFPPTFLPGLTSRGHALDGEGVSLLEWADRQRVGQLLAPVAQYAGGGGRD